MEKSPRQVYTNEFRQQAVELITREGISLAEAAHRLSISPKTLLNRVRRAKTGNLSPANSGASRHVVTNEEAELSRLRREVAELRMVSTMRKQGREVLRAFEGACRGAPLRVRKRNG